MISSTPTIVNTSTPPINFVPKCPLLAVPAVLTLPDPGSIDYPTFKSDLEALHSIEIKHMPRDPTLYLPIKSIIAVSDLILKANLHNLPNNSPAQAHAIYALNIKLPSLIGHAFLKPTETTNTFELSLAFIQYRLLLVRNPSPDSISFTKVDSDAILMPVLSFLKKPSGNQLETLSCTVFRPQENMVNFSTTTTTYDASEIKRIMISVIKNLEAVYAAGFYFWDISKIQLAYSIYNNYNLPFAIRIQGFDAVRALVPGAEHLRYAAFLMYRFITGLYVQKDPLVRNRRYISHNGKLQIDSNANEEMVDLWFALNGYSDIPLTDFPQMLNHTLFTSVTNNNVPMSSRYYTSYII